MQDEVLIVDKIGREDALPPVIFLICFSYTSVSNTFLVFSPQFYPYISFIFPLYSQNQNPAYNKLLYQREMVNEIIEDVVTFENGGLNNSVDALTEVSQGVCERERVSVCE